MTERDATRAERSESTKRALYVKLSEFRRFRSLKRWNANAHYMPIFLPRLVFILSPIMPRQALLNVPFDHFIDFMYMRL